VTAAIESPVQANAGIGFAIPSSIVAKVVPELISEGHYEHSWLGISGTSLVPDLAEAMDLDSTQRGVLIAEVMPNSPADKAGLRGSDRQVEIEGQQVNVGGDVITAIDNHLVREMDDLIAYLASDTVVGQEISLTILRDGKQQVLTFNLAARPTPEENQANQPSQGAHLGIIGLDVNSALAEAMNLSEDTQGVLVEQVEQGSPADEAGLRGSYKPVTIDGQDVLIGGDVITAVDGQTISGMQDLKAMLSQMEPDQEITLTVQRDGKLLEVDVTLGG
jgi:serine protease Do